MKLRTSLVLAALFAAVATATLAIPLYVIRPFRPQAPDAFALALSVRSVAPWVSLLCALAVLVIVLRAWSASRFGGRFAMAFFLLFTAAVCGLTHINIFEKMFKPYGSPSFVQAASAPVEPADMVLAVNFAGQPRAYPVRLLGYHHIVNDTAGDTPYAVTYCTLCHTGMVWSRILNGRTLTFRLAGINNGNALLRDEQTSTIWQQSTGEAVFGPLKGQHLTLLHADELSFALWRAEQPNGQVLRANPTYQPEYDPKDWERHVEKTHVVVDTATSGIPPHALMLGVTTADSAKAYPVDVLLAERVVQDTVSGDSILLLAGPDHASLRVFHAKLASGRALTFTLAGDDVTDAETGSRWSFQGCAVTGALAGQCLTPLDSHKDFWFDWMHHNPQTAVYKG